jgi:hypothetical protein
MRQVWAFRSYWFVLHLFSRFITSINKYLQPVIAFVRCIQLVNSLTPFRKMSLSPSGPLFLPLSTLVSWVSPCFLLLILPNNLCFQIHRTPSLPFIFTTHLKYFVQLIIMCKSDMLIYQEILWLNSYIQPKSKIIFIF